MEYGWFSSEYFLYVYCYANIYHVGQIYSSPSKNISNIQPSNYWIDVTPRIDYEAKH